MAEPVRIGPDGEPIVEEEEGRSLRDRLVPLALLFGAIALVVYLLFLQPPGYTVKATFQNASQVVEGNQVILSGAAVGKVTGIEISDDNRAELELQISDDVAPLPRGTEVVIRSASLSGVANRFVQLKLPERRTGEIPDGGRLDAADTTSEVDLDAIFNTLDKPTRAALQRTIKGVSDLYRGAGREGNEAIRYANPLLSTSRRLFGELNRDERALEGFVVDGAKVVTALAERRDDVAGLVSNLNQTMGALASRDRELARSINQLPPFMRQANTTFANLRGTLDDLDPLVAESKPVAKRLQPFLPQLRRFATGAIPVVRDLQVAIRNPGADNDLVELLRSQPALARIGVGPVNRNGAERQGALPETVVSLRDSVPNLSFFRPYTPELIGWADGFGHGPYDANGGFGRIHINLNTFSVSTDNTAGLPLLGPLIDSVEGRLKALTGIGKVGYRERCPGAGERDRGDGSTPFTDGGTLNCDPTQVPIGP